MAAASQAPISRFDALPVVRQTVRTLLLSTPSFHKLDPAKQRQMAEAMVRVCHAAVSLFQEELDSDREARRKPVPSRFLAREQSAGSDFSGVSAQRVASTTQAILNAVSFPRFVTDLINGVFKAMVDSTVQQMHSFVELLNNVAASTDGFADSNMGADRARAWLIEKYPGVFEKDADSDADPEEQAEVTLHLKDGAQFPSQESLRASLGVEPGESIPGGDPESLVPFARRQLAKTRQQMLATMVMLGMQRIVVDSGRITASMRFHIDTRSAAQADQGSTLSEENKIKAAGSFGFGPWGASASVENNLSYVSTQRSQTTEEMNTDLDLNSSVEINFKTDYLPLNRMTSANQADRIRANSINPDQEAKAEIEARSARYAKAIDSESARRQSLDKILTPPGPTLPKPPVQEPAAPKPATPKPAMQSPAAQKPPSQTPRK